MADPSLHPASFWTQSNALLRKNLTFQKRNVCSNVGLVLVPAFFCLLIGTLQFIVDKQLGKPNDKCGSGNISSNVGDNCAIPKHTEWPPLLQMPAPRYRAVGSDFVPFTDLPNESCRQKESCPVTILMTGSNQSFGETVARNLFLNSISLDSSSIMDNFSNDVMGTESTLGESIFSDPGLMFDRIYNVQRQCSPNSTFYIPVPKSLVGEVQLEVRCVQGLHLWRNSSSEVDNELYEGYRMGNSEGKINEILAAYDFSNSNTNNFNVTIWYNSTFKEDKDLLRLPRSVNLASSAYVQFLKGSGATMLFQFVKEMPKPETVLRLDFSSLLGTIFFAWVILQLFTVVLKSLVHEKQQKLRIMMKMHGLGDGPYWIISYTYFLVVSSIYMLCFVIFGSVIDRLKFFTLNDYRIQFIFYFTYINLQIAFAFLGATLFSNVKTSTVIGYIFVFGTGLFGASLFQFFVQDTSLPRIWIFGLELYPGFSLYRGLYEFAQYSFEGNYVGTGGMQWENLSDRHNGMIEVLIIMAVEWFLVLFLAYSLDQVESSGSGRSHLFCLQTFMKKKFSYGSTSSLQM